MKRFLLVILLMFAAWPAFAQTDNTFYVKQFVNVQNRTVAAATTAAQNSCNSNTSIPCVIIFDPTLAVYALGTMPAQCSQCQWVDYSGVTGSTATYTSAGIFTNVSNHCGLQGLVGGGTMSLFSSSGAGSFTQDGVCGVVFVPLGSTVSQADGVTGIVDCHANGPAVTSGPACMGGYFQTHMFGSNSATWGINTVGVLMTGANNDTLQNEVDFDLQSGVSGAIINGWSIQSPVMNSAPLSATGVVVGKPSCTTADFGTYPNTGCPQWSFGFATIDGATAVGVNLGANGTGSNRSAQQIQVTSVDAGGVRHTGSYGQTASGDMFIAPSSGNGFSIVGATTVTTGLTTAGAGLKVTGSVSAGTGMQHKRAAGCATTAAAGAVCTTTVTWATAFADANYTVTCGGDVVTSGVPTDGGLSAKAAASATFRTVAATAVAAQYTNVDCIAMHD